MSKHAAQKSLHHISVRPVADDGAAAIEGVTIDRAAPNAQGVLYNSAQAYIAAGAATGTPTSFTVTAKVQESSDDSTWTDVASGALTVLTAVNTDAVLNLDLEGLKRYVRIHLTNAFVGGTSPTIGCSAGLTLMEPKETPAA